MTACFEFVLLRKRKVKSEEGDERGSEQEDDEVLASKLINFQPTNIHALFSSALALER